MKLTDLLDRPIAYHRVFVTLTGSVKAAIMLSQAMYWQKRAKQGDGWWYKTAEEWQEETGLSRHEQDTARKACEKYLKTDLRDVPARTYWRVDEEVLSADLFAEKRQSSLAESGKLDSRKAANINKYAETTTENTTDGEKEGDLLDLQMKYAAIGKERGEDQIEAVLVELEIGLRVNIDRSLKNQQVAKRIVKDGRPVSAFISWVMSDEWRADHAYMYADMARVWQQWPQAFVPKSGYNPQGLEVGF